MELYNKILQKTVLFGNQYMNKRIIDYLGREHLREVNMGYFEHLRRAWLFAQMGFTLFFKAFMHGLLPCLFDTCAMDAIKKMVKTYGFYKVITTLREEEGK